MSSHDQFAELWDSYYIYESMGADAKVHYIFTAQAQQAIIAQAIDYATAHAHEYLLKAVNGKTAYTDEFKSFFKLWMEEYMPGTSFSVSPGPISGGVPFVSGPSDNNC
ncbi:hypothetical protein [Deminuibacter soli]|uniref:Uncharacterized protein n=1 Tax=Deminuibacter soli TaxID=2291815 RepID=A0A3E1NMR5_9BACT|nr:hypothetical protein [Deminuibacter soli]RFM29108.1 hypothetical protein DXN05_10165 [Deminuibacter soli]